MDNSTAPIPLLPETLDQLSPTIARPTYDRSQTKPGVVHLGIGNFNRAHQAVYFDDLLNLGFSDWAMTAVSLRSTNTRDSLYDQNFLYSIIERDNNAHYPRIIGAVTNILVAPYDTDKVEQALADPQTKVVTLTVTEKGYYYDPLTRGLDFEHPDIRKDLAAPDQPTTTIGYLVKALDQRRHAGTKPFTVISCDNLAGNGDILRRCVLDFAAQKDRDLERWIEDRVTFPNTMVDRITPETTDKDIRDITSTYGFQDKWPVMTERFRQWVIEDKFCNDRPPLEQAGVQFVSDVRPYELMKLRMLNGNHRVIAAYGHTLKKDFIHEAMAVPEIKTLVSNIMDENITVLPPVPGMNLQDYKQSLLDRFSNPYIRDQILRVSKDGSQKIGARLLDPIRDAIASNKPMDHLVTGLAGWIFYVGGIYPRTPEQEQRGVSTTYKVVDCWSRTLQDKVWNIKGQGWNQALLGAQNPRPILEITDIFGEDLPQNQIFVSKLEACLKNLYTKGVIETLRNDQPPPQQAIDHLKRQQQR